MKQIYLLIGIMLALVVCITPVAAVSADDFNIDSEMDEGDIYPTYTYSNVNNPYERYIEICVGLSRWMFTIVTFKPANIPDAPVMVVDATTHAYVYLPYHSVDEWEIKYYSSFGFKPSLTDKYLKNAGTVNLKKKFGKYIEKRLYFERSTGQYIRPDNRWDLVYRIPDVD